MGTYTLNNYQAVWKQRAAELRKAARKSTQTAAMFMRKTARGMAPRKTGKLMKGIRADPKGDAIWEVSSSVEKDFPYNLWVNRTPPYSRIHPWWNDFQSTTYGDGHSHINTGVPGYWNLAKGQTIRFFGRIARENVRKIFKDLKVRIT